MPNDSIVNSSRPPGRLAEVAAVFTRLGFTAFGGPAAHLAMMEDEVVRRRQWLDREHFLDLVAAINFIPGPSSTQLAIQLGLIRAGYRGLVTAGLCFITPAVLIILPIAWAYVRFSASPQSAIWLREMMGGVNAAVIAIVAAACVRFAKTAVRDSFTAAVVVLSFAGQLFLRRFPGAQPELIVLACAGAAGALWYRQSPGAPLSAAIPLLMGQSVMAAGPPAATGGLLQMSGFFLKVGGTLFGSGYVLVSYLQSGVVEHYHWLTPRQLLDAIAVGQFTPGPLLTTATFVGYLRGIDLYGSTLGGAVGAVVATVSIFFPSFVLVALLGPLLPRIRQSAPARAAFKGMNAAVVALIAAVAVRLALDALWPVNAVNVPIALLGFLSLVAWNVNATWLILVGAAAGLARHAFGGG